MKRRGCSAAAACGWKRPQRLAKWLYGKPLVAKSSKPEQKIPLATPVPVYITYLTVGAENGRLAYRQDVYNRDPARLAELAALR